MLLRLNEMDVHDIDLFSLAHFTPTIGVYHRTECYTRGFSSYKYTNKYRDFLPCVIWMSEGIKVGVERSKLKPSSNNTVWSTSALASK